MGARRGNGDIVDDLKQGTLPAEFDMNNIYHFLPDSACLGLFAYPYTR